MHSAEHGLALCYNASQLNIIEVNYIPSVLEILLTVLKLEKDTFLLVVYRMLFFLVTSLMDLLYWSLNC